MDRRPEELKHIGILVDFMTDEYPQYFGKSEYTHPVKGVCKSLILKTSEKRDVDYVRISSIDINYDFNICTINLNTPSESYQITNFIKDKTVM